MMYLHTGPSEKDRIGKFSVCSSMFPETSYRPVTKSLASQRIGERVVFWSEMLISSVSDLKARAKTDTRMGSTSLTRSSPAVGATGGPRDHAGRPRSCHTDRKCKHTR